MPTNRPARESRDGARRECATEVAAPGDAAPVRLNKYLASHGVGSRRRCDELISDGAVMVDGEIVTELGRKVDPEVQRVEVDGVVLRPDKIRHRYYLLNKPAGVVCTNDARESKPRAVDLVDDPRKGRVFTVGRLDEDTVGIVLITNDGEFANRIQHPRYEVPKTYLVKLSGKVTAEDLDKLRKGVWIAEGKTAAAQVRVGQRTSQQTRLFVTLREGKNREVRRMFARLGYRLLDLKRVRIGPVSDRGLKPGRWRPLTRAEVGELLAWSDPERREALEKAARPRRKPRGRRPARSGRR